MNENIQFDAGGINHDTSFNIIEHTSNASISIQKFPRQFTITYPVRYDGFGKIMPSVLLYTLNIPISSVERLLKSQNNIQNTSEHQKTDKSELAQQFSEEAYILISTNIIIGNVFRSISYNEPFKSNISLCGNNFTIDCKDCEHDNIFKVVIQKQSFLILLNYLEKIKRLEKMKCLEKAR